MPTFIPPLKESIIFDAAVSPLDATGKVVVITGTSTGLGLVAARTCALKGAAGLVLLNRPRERATDAVASIAALAGPGTDVVSVPCDIASCAGPPAEVFDELIAELLWAASEDAIAEPFVVQ